jgi:sugar transferase EpsL
LNTTRIFDLVATSAALIVLFPLLLVIAALVRLFLGAPVLFWQERPGLHGRLFPLVKFRTMTDAADAEGHPLPDADRLTRFGRFLRSTSLDELPELWNVLTGDMSLVGPRPLPVRDYNHFNEDWHRRRFSVKPGITCLWQVGGRSDLDFDRWMELDMLYIDHWSFWLDMKILLRTIPAVLQSRGAS